MKAFPLFLGSLLPSIIAAQNITFLADLLQSLQGAGLSQLVTVAGQLNSTEVGQYLLANISNGSPHVLFAPSNEACEYSIFCSFETPNPSCAGSAAEHCRWVEIH